MYLMQFIVYWGPQRPGSGEATTT